MSATALKSTDCNKSSSALEELNGGQVSKRSLHRSLQTAFGAFDQLSKQLNQSYRELEQQLTELQDEVVQADADRQRENEAKKALADRFTRVLNIMPVAVVLLDDRGIISQANFVAASFLGEGLVGKPWIEVINEKLSPHPTDGHEIALRDGRLVSIATQGLENGDGQVVVLTDQTETRRLQAKLNHSRKLSEMGRMTASLAHQIRTPLSTAMLYADHLCSDQLSEERRIRYAHKLKSRLSNLDQQVRDLLVFSRGGIVLESKFPIFQLAAMAQVHLDELCKSKHAVIEMTDQIPTGTVRCNSELLLSALTNLVDNAIEACLQARIEPKITIELASSAGFIEFIIADNGPGIPESIRSKVFEPFFTTKSTGTGLGLAVVQAVIQAHGGNVYLENTDEGAAVRVILPLLSDQHQKLEYHNV